MPSAIVLLIVWVLYRLDPSSAVLSFASLFILATITYITGCVLQNIRYFGIRDIFLRTKRIFTNTSKNSNTTSNKPPTSMFVPIRIFGFSGVLIYLIVWFCYWFFVSMNQSLVENLARLVELLFWLVVAYFSGVAAWIVGEIPIYILRGLKRIPMHLKAIDHFRNIQVVEKVGLLSAVGVSIMFLFVISIAALQEFTSLSQTAVWDTGWVIIWAQLAFVGLYTGIAIILGGNTRRRLFVFLSIYIPLQLVLGEPQNISGFITDWFPSLNQPAFVGSLFRFQYVRLIVLGFFLSYISYFQSVQIYGVIKDIKEHYKQIQADHFRNVINSMEERLQNPQKEQLSSKNHKDSREVWDSSGPPVDIIRALEMIDAEPTESNFYRRLITVLSPLIGAFIIPLLVNYLSKL
jgi:hypothetical protein